MKNTCISILSIVVLSASTLAAQITKQEMPGIRNFSRVDATIGCGGATAPEAMPALKQAGFVSVINLRLADEPGADIAVSREAAARAGIKYFHIPLTSSKPEPAQIEKVLQTVSDKTNQPVFIHCGSANRVGAVWLIKRVRIDGWPVDQAVAEAETIGLTSRELKDFAVRFATRK